MDRSCLDCSAPISAQSKTGRCRPCAARACGKDPALIEKRAATHRRKFREDTAYRERKARLMRTYNKRPMTPERIEALRAIMRKNRRGLEKPEARAKWMAGRAEAGRKRHETVMAWCPVQYRALYTHLRVSKKFKAAEARQMIEDMLTPFDRQMLRVRAGASISIKPLMPSKVYDCTLGGVTGAML